MSVASVTDVRREAIRDHLMYVKTRDNRERQRVTCLVMMRMSSVDDVGQRVHAPRGLPTPLRQGPNNPSSRKIGNGRTLDMSAEKTRTRPGRPNAGKIQPRTSPTQPRGKNAPHEEPELHIPVVHAKPSQHLCTGPRKEQPRETAKLPGLYRTRQALKTLGDKMPLPARNMATTTTLLRRPVVGAEGTRRHRNTSIVCSAVIS